MKELNFRLSILFPVVILSIPFSYGANILAIFPLPIESHFAMTSSVMKSLIVARHKVTIVSPFSSDHVMKNLGSIDSLHSFREDLLKSDYQHTNNGANDVNRIGYQYKENLCDQVFNSEAFQEIFFSNKSFDVIFIEMLEYYKCFLPIAKKLNVPVIGVFTTMSSSIADLATKNPHHPADVPFDNILHWRFDEFYYRLYNLWRNAYMKYFWRFEMVPLLEKFHRDHEDKLKPYDGYLDIEPVLIFSNSHHSILPRANNPNVIEIGGVHIGPAKPLPQNIQEFIDEADHGVILFTFGSMVKVSSLPARVWITFLVVFESLPQRVLWKFENPLILQLLDIQIPNNIMMMDWFPQRDILEHPNVKAFISHCGLSGMYEAIYTATPIISCPLRGDQPSNAAILENLGVAVHLDIESITVESLLSAINSIFNDTKYYDKMQKVSRAFLDRPLSPHESVAFWTKYVIKHKDTLNLMPPSGKLNWFQYYLLDIVSPIVGTVGLTLYLCSLFVKALVKFVRRKFSAKKDKSD